MIAWNPSVDETVVGYNLYYGGASGIYTNMIHSGNVTNQVVSSLVSGTTYYFAATAYDSNGVESPFSNEANYTVPDSTSGGSGGNGTVGNIIKPSVPTGLRVVSIAKKLN